MLSLALLGSFQAHLDERPLTQFYTTKAQALLIYLAVESRQVHQREGLMTLLWPDLPLKSAQQNLRQALYRLRMVIEPEDGLEPFILAERLTISWNPDAVMNLDVAQFETLSSPGRTPEEWQQAANLCRGEFLSDFYLTDSEPFESWALNRRAAYSRTAHDLLERLAGFYLEAGRYGEAETAVRRNLELDYYQEAAHRQLMEALAANGRRQEALAHFEALREQIQAEFGLEPEPETTALVSAIRSGRQLTSSSSQNGNGTATAGSPTVPNESERFAVTNNLPIPPTAFIGREAELTEIDALMNREDGRMVTVVGPGGMGKTRLALAWAAAQVQKNGRTTHPFQHGIHFVNLAPLSTADLIVPALANALSFPLQKSGDQERRSPRQQILDYLCQKRMLLVMDNFEHLLEGSDLVLDILAVSTHVKILATSRERLNLRREQVFPIEGLAFPDWETPEDAADYTAVQLFLESARRNQPDFSLTGDDLTYLARICRLVAGMPLAIELAAAWVELLPLAEIAAEIQQGLDILETEMRDVPARQRSIRATIDYSWQKLDGAEQEIFNKMSVFRGSFTREAAQSVTGASLRQLARLQNKSLLQVDREGHRYQLHELLRQYAAEKLAHEADAVQAEVNGRHAHFYANLLAGMEPLFYGILEEETRLKLQIDQENIDAAWKWLVARRHIEPLLESINSLHYFYEHQTRIQDGFERCDEIINWCGAPEDDQQKLLLIRALSWKSDFSFFYTLQNQLAEENLARAAVLLDELAQAETELDYKNDQAFYHYLEGQRMTPGVMATAEAIDHIETAQRLFQEAGNLKGVVLCLNWLSHVQFFNFAKQGGYEKSLALSKVALALAHQIGSDQGMGEVLAIQGSINRQAGNMPMLAFLVEEIEKAIQQLEDRGKQYERERLLDRYGAMLAVLGRYEEGMVAQLEYERLREEMGLPLHFIGEYRKDNLLNHLGRFEEAKQNLEDRLAKALDREDNWIAGLNYISLGMCLMAMGDLETAVDILQKGKALQVLTENPMDMAGTQANLGLALCHVGKVEEAKEPLRNSLELVVKAHAYFPLIEVLPGIALVLAQEGPAQQLEAVTLFGLLQTETYYANSKLFMAISGHHLEAVVESLPAEAAQSALERGRNQEIWAAATALLERLHRDWD